MGSGTTGVSGVVSAANSLVGSNLDDDVGNPGVTVLTNGNYVVRSATWDNGALIDAGAVTWGNGATGVSGVISAANSLIGNSANDYVGLNDSVTALSNGNYVVRTLEWNNGIFSNAGAVTWGNGTTGIRGIITAANSLVGSTYFDEVGSTGITALSNGNYVVRSATWDNGAVSDAGAVTWGNGTTGVSGVVSASNSLVGSTASDNIGNTGVTALNNGHYVVRSTNWDNGAATNAGAVTWGNGTMGVGGVVSAANSLVGSTSSDNVGITGIIALNNGSYVFRSQNWDNAASIDAGAVTWGSGTTGVSGAVSAANSLIGSTASDAVGTAITALSNGHYVVRSPTWDNGAAANAGAVTWGSGTTGVSGVVSAANSLVGTKTNDNIGNDGITVLGNGNYVVRSAGWDNGATANVGAVTWGNGATGISGSGSTANSLIGTTSNDSVGSSGVAALTNGHYVVQSGNWDNGATSNPGAVTWANGTTGLIGVVSTANSLFGSKASDFVGNTSVIALSNGNYVVVSSASDNGAVIDAGAVTWGNGTTGTIGAVSAANSLVGSTVSDAVGTDSVGSASVTSLANGNYVVRSARWDNGAATNAGGLTFGNGSTGVSGTITSSNSAIGLTSSSNLQAPMLDNVNSTFFGRFLADGGGRIRVGSQVDGFTPLITNAILDDGDGSFSTTGPWSTYTAGGRGGDLRYLNPVSPAGTATWAFNGLQSGQYRVSATWP
ncbi:MAG: hypothetical protein SH850_01315, partial [Planctomycetaceae bacterium]|nr:hypothetical protein [Planctomycetaceae bacterium]